MASEKELVILAKIGSHKGLGKALAIFMQEQAQIKAGDGRIRVRMERPESDKDGWKYTLTTKSNYRHEDGVQMCDEDDEGISAKAYEMFKSTCKDFQRKIRYIFKIEDITIESPGMTGAELVVPELKYEVDVFFTAQGKLSTWCKIDVELDPLFEAMKKAGIDPDQPMDLKLKLSKLPFRPKAAFMEDKNNPKSKALAWAIYEYEFNRPVRPPVEGELAPAKEGVVGAPQHDYQVAGPTGFAASFAQALIGTF